MKALFVALRAIFYAACFVLFWGWLARGARRYDERFGLAAPVCRPGVSRLQALRQSLDSEPFATIRIDLLHAE